MPKLFVDDNIMEDGAKVKEEREAFQKKVDDFIKNHYKQQESEALYALFNPQQVEVMKAFFKGFSVETYRELNGTVELQVKEKQELQKKKLDRIAQYMGPINLKDWVYDGMVDTGARATKCDLCPVPIRYAHYAVHKKTGNTLRFGCNCASDFFNMNSDAFASLRTIQKNMLVDIKLVACIMENNLFKEYYSYMGGYIGKTLLEEGPQALRDLTTFMVKWVDKEHIQGDEEKDEYLVVFGDNTKVTKSMKWIKEHIATCINADLSDDLYKSAMYRNLVPLKAEKDDKAQLNTTGYIKYALKFVELNMPIPLSLMKKINSQISKITRKHHPDYKKFAEEMLISMKLSKSNLLMTAFTDFITNYYASSIAGVERDPELIYWGVRGPATFRNMVFKWETAMVKLEFLREVNSLITNKLLTEEELDRKAYIKSNTGVILTTRRLRDLLKDVNKLLISKKEVLRVPENIDNGYSKYMLKDVDLKLGLEDDKTAYANFTAKGVPVLVGWFYLAVEDAYRSIIRDSLGSLMYFLSNIKYAQNEEEVLKYIMCYKQRGSSVMSLGCSMYHMDRNRFVEEIEAWKDSFPTSKYDEWLEKYKGQLIPFRDDCNQLFSILSPIMRGLRKDTTKKITPANINDDYEDLVVKQEKTMREYFTEYCDLLISKRANKRMQPYLNQQNLYGLIPFKQLNGYASMLEEIHIGFTNQARILAAKKFYTTMHFADLKKDLGVFVSTDDMDTLLNYIIASVFNYRYNIDIKNITNEFNKLQFRRIGKVSYYTDGLKDHTVEALLETVVKPDTLKYIKETHIEYFKDLIQKIQELYAKLDESSFSFENFYSLVRSKTPEFEKAVAECKTSSDFTRCLNSNIGPRSFAYPMLDNFDTCDFMSYLGDIFEGFNCAKDFDNKLRDIIDNSRADQDRTDLVNNEILPVLKEHIMFFDIDVDYIRNTDNKYKSYRDDGIRRALSFRKTSYQTTYEVLQRCVKELEVYNDLSPEIQKYIEEARNVDSADDGKCKALKDALITEMYNRNLIMNHFNILKDLLIEVQNTFLYDFSKQELEKFRDILGVYYIFRSDANYLADTLKGYQKLRMDYYGALNKLPLPTKRAVTDVYDSMKEQNELGVKLATEILAHPYVQTLNTYLVSIANTVKSTKNCSRKQLFRLKQACGVLKIPVDDTSSSATTTNDNIVSSSDTSTNSATTATSGVVKLPDDEAEKMHELARQIKNHPDFKTLPNFKQNIITTVSRYDIQRDRQKGKAEDRINRCSVNQKKYILEAKEALGIS